MISNAISLNHAVSISERLVLSVRTCMAIPEHNHKE